MTAQKSAKKKAARKKAGKKVAGKKSAAKKKSAAAKKKAAAGAVAGKSAAAAGKPAAKKTGAAQKPAPKRAAAPKSAASVQPPKDAAGEKATDGISSLNVNLGHVFALRPRVSTSFRQADFLVARRRLQEEAYASIEEAARAVTEKALELTHDGPTKRGSKTQRGGKR